MQPVPVRATGYVAFLPCVPPANCLIGDVGTTCVPNGPCLVPVAPGIAALSGVPVACVTLVLRDVVQRCLGITLSIVAIIRVMRRLTHISA